MPKAPSIAKLAARVLLDMENAVRRFSRLNKYSVGAELRMRAMSVAHCIARAWRDPANRMVLVDQVVTAIDDLKISMQLAQHLKAFGSFAEFEALAKLVHELGQQGGGWLKKLQSNGQNAGGRDFPQRALILSAPSAQEATR